MNITKDLFEYVNIVRNSFHSHHFSIKVEPQSIIDECMNRLKEISKTEKNIDKINESMTLL